MTFIATVIAKKGVALIADSLVTTSISVLEYDSFKKYLEKKLETSKDGDFKVDIQEISRLFKSKPSYTKDYHEKIFEYDSMRSTNPI